MYVRQKDCIEPEDENIKVWRYMDFTKFVSLLNSQKLYFTRADRLRDPFEGSYTVKSLVERKKMLNALGVKGDKIKDQMFRYSKLWEKGRKCYAICSWHLNKHESMAMWHLYLKSSEGVAIQSTYSRLKRNLIDERDIYLGKVNYVDYDIESFPVLDHFIPFLNKRIDFEFEKEVRAIIESPRGEDSLGAPFITNGIEIKVDLYNLIQRVYISPTAPTWFTDLVKEVVLKYGYYFEVVQSKLNKDPIY